MDMIDDKTRFGGYILLLTKQEEVVESIIDRFGNLDAFELEKKSNIQLMHKISEELNTQRIQPPLIFYKLGRFSKIYFENQDIPILQKKR